MCNALPRLVKVSCRTQSQLVHETCLQAAVAASIRRTQLMPQSCLALIWACWACDLDHLKRRHSFYQELAPLRLDAHKLLLLRSLTNPPDDDEQAALVMAAWLVWCRASEQLHSPRRQQKLLVQPFPENVWMWWGALLVAGSILPTIPSYRHDKPGDLNASSFPRASKCLASPKLVQGA